LPLLVVEEYQAALGSPFLLRNPPDFRRGDYPRGGQGVAIALAVVATVGRVDSEAFRDCGMIHALGEIEKICIRRSRLHPLF